MENCLPWGEHHTGAGAESEEEGAAETTCDELTVTPIPHPPVLLGGRRERNWECSSAWEEGRGGGKVFVRFGFISHYSTLI